VRHVVFTGAPDAKRYEDQKYIIYYKIMIKKRLFLDIGFSIHRSHIT